MKRHLKDVDPAVFWGSAVLIAAFVGWGLVAPDSLGSVMGTALTWVIGNFGWAFILIAFGVLVLCIFLAVSPWGRIRLGPDDSRPEFGTFSWVSMMFAAGLGAGLLFYGDRRAGHALDGAAPRPRRAAQRGAALTALRYTYFHWGFNGWAMYAVMGGAMAYFGFRKNQPILVSATFSPILGPDRAQPADRPAHRRPGHRGHAVRHGHRARPQRAAAQQRPRLPLRRAEVQHRGGAHHRRGHRTVPGLGHVGRREGHQLPGQPRAPSRRSGCSSSSWSPAAPRS